jgi:hypothetical protein
MKRFAEVWMMARADRFVRIARVALVLTLAIPLAAHPHAQAAAQATPARAGSLPARLSDSDFWKLQAEISEPGGFFRITDNYTSNEPEIGRVFTMLRETGIAGGVYVGVGPEQNLTYIAATRPAMAFIVDIRRQAAIQHLMFKAVFELSKDRADFLSLLFSKPRPAQLDDTTATAIDKVWEPFFAVESDAALRTKTYQRIVTHLTKTHGFTLTAQEMSQLQSVFDAFWAYGPAITTRGAAGGGGGGNNVTFADLTGYSYDAAGRAQSFLGTEADFQFVKTLHERNLLVPVTGDFGGPQAIRAIGKYLHGHGATVSAFYVSNVEQYLFQDGKDRAFYDNVATLPLTPSSVFIRPYSLRRGGGPTQSLCAIAPFLTAVQANRIYTNNQALDCVR